MHPLFCLLHPSKGPNLINESFVRQQWMRHTKRVNVPRPCTATKQAITLEGIIPLHTLAGDLCVQALVWNSRKFCRGRTRQDILHPPLRSWYIPSERKGRPFALARCRVHQGA